MPLSKKFKAPTTREVPVDQKILKSCQEKPKGN